MSSLVCPVCGLDLDWQGPGVGSDRSSDDRDVWARYWVPFIGDLRGSPLQLVHAKCFVNEHGFDAFIELVIKHDMRNGGPS